MTEGDGWPSDANACQKHEAGRLLQLRAEAIAKKTDAYLWIKTVVSNRTLHQLINVNNCKVEEG